MPADTLTISLTGPLADEVRAAAEASGLTPEEYVRQTLADGFMAESELDWEEDLRRLEEPGENADAETVFAEFRQRIIEVRRAKP